MKTIKIIGIASPICWWIDCVGQICPVLNVYPPTGYIQIEVKRHEVHVVGQPIVAYKGWIDPQYIEVVEYDFVQKHKNARSNGRKKRWKR